MNQRPGSIPIVAAFLFAATVIAGTVGVSLLGKSPFFERLWELNKPAERAFRAHSTVFGILLLVRSAAALASGVGSPPAPAFGLAVRGSAVRNQWRRGPCEPGDNRGLVEECLRCARLLRFSLFSASCSGPPIFPWPYWRPLLNLFQVRWLLTR